MHAYRTRVGNGGATKGKLDDRAELRISQKGRRQDMYILYCAQTRRATLLLQVQPRWTDREEEERKEGCGGGAECRGGKGREGRGKERTAQVGSLLMPRERESIHYVRNWHACTAYHVVGP